MPTVTRLQLRNFPHLNAMSGCGPSEDTLPRTIQESDIDNDPMDGSFAALSSGKEDEEQESVWGEQESESSEDESDHDPDDDDDYEGDFLPYRGYLPCKLRTQQHAPRQSALSWRKLGAHHHRSLPRRSRRLESIAGSRADCRTCYRCPLMPYSWYAQRQIPSPPVAEQPIF